MCILALDSSLLSCSLNAFNVDAAAQKSMVVPKAGSVSGFRGIICTER